jgi:superoxide reductase
MKLRAKDAGHEKHVPIVEQTGDGVKVTVGEVAHPMEEKHYIQWIEIRQGCRLWRAELTAGDEPVARFVGVTGDVVAREFCNKHGLWEGHPQ